MRAEMCPESAPNPREIGPEMVHKSHLDGHNLRLLPDGKQLCLVLDLKIDPKSAPNHDKNGP